MHGHVPGKKTLEDFSNRMVAIPNVPVANSFSALRMIPRDFPDGQIRQIREMPQRAYAQHAPARAQKSTIAQAIYRAHKTVRAKKAGPKAKVQHTNPDSIGAAGETAIELPK